MAEISEEELKSALATARQLQRRHSSSANGFARAQRLAEQRSFAERTLLPALAAASHDPGEFGEISARANTSARQLLAKHKAVVARRAASVRERLRADAASRRRLIEHLAARNQEELSPNFNFNFVILDTPVFILPSQDIVLDLPHIEPWNNIAMFTGEWDTDTEPYPGGFDEVSFVFVWRNPSDGYAVVNIELTMLFNGFGETYASAGTFVNNDIFLDVDAVLDVLEWWNNPPTSPPSQSGQAQRVIRLHSNASGIWAWGDPEFSEVSGYYDVRYQGFVLPPQGVAVFEVKASIYHLMYGSGTSRVDFESGTFEVMCPAVVLAILN